MFIFNKEYAQNGLSGTNHKAQREHVRNRWASFEQHDRAQIAMNADHARMFGNASAVIPRDVYQEFENQSVAVLRESNLTLLQDLMPLAKALPLGKVEHIYRKASDSGSVQTDLDMSVPAELDKTSYSYASSIKVFHKSGFGRGWMEMEGQRSEGFDGLVDDQANATRAVLEAMAGHIYNGVDKTFNGTAAYGIKTAAATTAVDLGASGLNVDFTASATTSAAIRDGVIGILDVVKNTNHISAPVTMYISAEIETRWMSFYDTSGSLAGKTIMQIIQELPGVAAVKVDQQLSGNELIAVVLQSQYIRPLVGMAVSTVPLFRANPWDNYSFVTWTNVGLEIKTDVNNKGGVFYASEVS